MKKILLGHHRATVIALAALTQPVFANTNNWICTDGDWNDTSCWTNGSVPANGDDAWINLNPYLNSVVTYTDSVTPVTLGIVFVSNGTLQQNGGALVSNTEQVQSELNSNGMHYQTAGTNTVSDVLWVGNTNSFSGTAAYNLSGGTLTTTTTLVVGFSGINLGTFNLSGGTHSTQLLTLNGGNYNLSENGVLSVAGAENIYTGSLMQTGGSNTVNELDVGVINSAGSGSSTYVLAGGQLNASAENIGLVDRPGDGAFTQTDGVNNVGYLSIGDGIPGYAGNGSYVLSGGTLTVANSERIGAAANGNFTQSGGLHTVAQLIVGGANSGLDGEFTGTGTYNLSGGNLQTDMEYIGGDGTKLANGVFNQSGGTHTITSGLFVSSKGTYTMTGGDLNVASLNNNGTINIDHADTAVNAQWIENDGTITIGHVNNSTPAGNPTVLTVSNSFDNRGNLTVAADAHINGDGVFNQWSGKAVVNGSMTLSAININGGTFGGSGTVSSLTINGGTVAPGDPQTLTVNGDLRMNSGVLDFKIASASDYDKIVAGGGIYLLGGTIEFDFIGGYTPHAGDTFEFLQGDVQTLNNLNFIYTGLASGFEFNTAFDTNGLSITALNDGQPVASVPLPTSAWLFGSGILGLIGTTRRRAES